MAAVCFMEKFGFPPNWRIGIRSAADLALKIVEPSDGLARLASRADRHFREVEEDGRVFSVPSKPLKKIQRAVLRRVLAFNFLPCVQGGVAERSIITNAKVHRRQRWVACIDIRKFFPSVHYTNIVRLFEELGCDADVAAMLTRLTTYKYQLPQGAPTSPVLANLLLHRLDERMLGLCRKAGFRYTRYFDDITISGRQDPRKFLPTIRSIIEQTGYRMHTRPGKLDIMHEDQDQIVTGLIVNDSRLRLPEGEKQKLTNDLEELRRGKFPLGYFENPVKAQESYAGLIAFVASVEPTIGRKLWSIFRKVTWLHE